MRVRSPRWAVALGRREQSEAAHRFEAGCAADWRHARHAVTPRVVRRVANHRPRALFD